MSSSSSVSASSGTVTSYICLLYTSGLGVWGVVNLLEGYGSDNPGSKSQGMKQLMAGGGIILIGTTLIPVSYTHLTVGGKYRMANKVCESSWPTAQPQTALSYPGMPRCV